MIVDSSPGRPAGLRNVGSYQVSGHPFLTGSKNMGSAGTEHKISFPFVTKNVTVINSGSADKEIKVHFTANSTNDDALANEHYIALNTNEDSFTFDVKCKEIYVTNTVASAGFMLFASLTSIHTGSMYALTGTGLTEFGDV
jgi:hypothetical protein